MKIYCSLRYLPAKIFLFFLFVMFFTFLGCSGPQDASDITGTGSASFSIQWPEDHQNESKNETLASVISEIETITISDECSARGVDMIRIDVRDLSDTLLASGTFVCSVGEGTVTNIPTGENRTFRVSAQNSSGAEIYRGEINNVTIRDGSHYVGHIKVSAVENTLPIAEITSPSDNSTFAQGNVISFSGRGLDAEDGTLSDTVFVWTSNIDGRINTGKMKFSTGALSIGRHEITLAVTDSQGAIVTDMITTIILLSPAPPKAATGGPYSGTEGLPVFFDGTGSSDADAAIVSYHWDFGDGNTGIGVAPIHTYAFEGYYTLTLTVTDSQGAVASNATKVMITAPKVPSVSNPPIIFHTPVTAANPGQSVTIMAGVTDPDIGDGISSVMLYFAKYDPDQKTPYHQESMINFSGDFYSAEISGDFIVKPGVVYFIAATDLNDVRSYEGWSSSPMLIQTDEKNIDNDGDGFTENQGDCNDSAPAIHPHAIEICGDAIDQDCDGNDQLCGIDNLPRTNITSPADGSSFTERESITFTGTGTAIYDVYKDLSGPSLVWTSDGQEIGTGKTISISTLSEESHTITLTATDSKGKSSSASITIEITNDPPEARITSPSTKDTIFFQGDEINFSGSATDKEDDDEALTYLWESDIDGEIGYDQYVIKNNLSSNTHDITLTVTDTYGEKDTATLTLTIHPDTDKDMLSDIWEEHYARIVDPLINPENILKIFGFEDFDKDHWSDRQEHDIEVGSGVSSDPTDAASPGGCPDEPWFVSDRYSVFQGDKVTINGVKAEWKDKILFYDPDEVLCGVGMVNNSGGYGQVKVYGDDSKTDNIDEGASLGDPLKIIVWDASDDEFYTVDDEADWESKIVDIFQEIAGTVIKWANAKSWWLNFTLND